MADSAFIFIMNNVMRLLLMHLMKLFIAYLQQVLYTLSANNIIV